MARYRRKQTIADAWQNVRGTHLPSPKWLQGRIWGRKGFIIRVKTGMGDVTVGPDDWVVLEHDIVTAIPSGVFAKLFERVIYRPAADAHPMRAEHEE